MLPAVDGGQVADPAIEAYFFIATGRKEKNT